MVETPDGVTSTRYTAALGSGLGATVHDDGSVELALDDPHGDIVTTVPVPASSSDKAGEIAGWAVFDEYGSPQESADTASVDTGVAAYGWLGAHERATDHTGLMLMCARLYNPITGRFLSPDPVAGGNENAYNYPDDPVGMADLDGRAAAFLVFGLAAGPVGWIVVGLAAVAVVAYGGYVWESHARKTPSRNGGRKGHATNKRNHDKHTKAQGHGGRKKFENPNQRKTASGQKKSPKSKKKRR